MEEEEGSAAEEGKGGARAEAEAEAAATVAAMAAVVVEEGEGEGEARGEAGEVKEGAAAMVGPRMRRSLPGDTAYVSGVGGGEHIAKHFMSTVGQKSRWMGRQHR